MRISRAGTGRKERTIRIENVPSQHSQGINACRRKQTNRATGVLAIKMRQVAFRRAGLEPAPIRLNAVYLGQSFHCTYT
jgi:hypothetical protein